MTSRLGKFVAEVAGTATLCTFGFGGAVTAGTFTSESPVAALLLVALAWGLGLALAIYGFASISGAHLNPTVTFVLAFGGRFPWRLVPSYVAAQIIGATAAAALVRGLYGDLAITAGLGASRLGAGYEIWQGFAAEAVAGFALLLSIYALAVGTSVPKHVLGIGVGVTLTGVILMLGPIAGASINLARSLGPELILSWSGTQVPWADLWVYVAGPMVGGLLAAGLCESLRGHDPQPVADHDEN